MADEFFTMADGVIWLQVGGPNSQPVLLGCHEIGDIAEPQGDVRRSYCGDITKRGKYRTVVKVQGPPGAKTFTLTAKTGKTANYLERVHCPIDLYVMQSKCASKAFFGAGYDRLVTLQGAVMTSKGESSLVSNEGTDDVNQTFEFDFENKEEIYPLIGTRQTNADVVGALALAFGDTESCYGDCGPYHDNGKHGVVTTQAGGAAAALILFSTDGGVTWTSSATQPFAVAEDAGAVVRFPVSNTLERVVVGRTDTKAATPAQVAWSDDYGATAWNLVSIGAVNILFLPHEGSLFSLDMEHIWAGLDSGAVWKSTDGALTWQQESCAMASAIHCVRFVDENVGLLVGAANAGYKSVDGGAHWSALTLPVAEAGIVCKAAHVIDRNNWWIGYANGHVYYTHNGGTTWAQRTLTYPGAVINAVNDIRGYQNGDAYTMFVAGKCTIGAAVKGIMWRSIDGGYTWESFISPTLDVGAIGWNAVAPITPNSAFVVGDIITTSTIYNYSD